MNKYTAFITIVKNEIFDNSDIYAENYPDIYNDALDYFNAILENNKDKTVEITENGKIVLKYMQDNNVTLGKAKDIAEGLGVPTRRVAGALRKLVTDGFAEKVATNPVIYGITEKGKNYKID